MEETELMHLGRVTRSIAQLILWVALFAAPMVATAQGNDLKLFGLVIGTNVSTDPEVKPLRYADDDAVQNARLLGELGAQVVLLADIDHDTQQLFPEVKTTPPTKSTIAQAMERLNDLMTQARAQGNDTHLYFFYSGHGDVENNQGYVTLNDARFWRDDLLALLRKSTAITNHVIIDACKSYFLVFDRGAGGKRAPLASALIGSGAELPVNTGVFLSTSSAADSHEWEAFQGGVFSHEVRSALRGAADQDLDSQITYEEAAAFVWGANVAVPNPRFRPKVFTKAPGGIDPRKAILMDLRATRGDRLDVGPHVSAHLFVEDEIGIRLADFRPTRGHKLRLILPTRRPLYVRYSDHDEEVELPSGRHLDLASLSTRLITVARRGAEHVAFHRLFARPFGPQTIQEYRHRPPETSASLVVPTDLTWLRRGAAILGVVGAVVGGTMTGLALNEKGNVKSSTHGIKRQKVNDRIDRFNGAAIASYSVAALGLATYFIWTFWPEDDVKIQVLAAENPQVQLSVDF